MGSAIGSCYGINRYFIFMPVQEEIFQHALSQFGIALRLVLDMDEKPSRLFAEVGFDKQVSGSFPAIKGDAFLVNERWNTR